MEKTNFCSLLLFLVFATLCNSQEYEYDDYNYNENYEYTDDYSQELNDYFDQTLLAPPIPPPLPPMPLPLPTPPPTPTPMGKMTFFYSKCDEI